MLAASSGRLQSPPPQTPGDSDSTFSTSLPAAHPVSLLSGPEEKIWPDRGFRRSDKWSHSDRSELLLSPLGLHHQPRILPLITARRAIDQPPLGARKRCRQSFPPEVPPPVGSCVCGDVPQRRRRPPPAHAIKRCVTGSVLSPPLPHPGFF